MKVLSETTYPDGQFNGHYEVYGLEYVAHIDLFNEKGLQNTVHPVGGHPTGYEPKWRKQARLTQVQKHLQENILPSLISTEGFHCELALKSYYA